MAASSKNIEGLISRMQQVGDALILLDDADGNPEEVKCVLKMESYLRDCGASLSEKDKEGNTALLLVAAGGTIPMVQWLLAHGARLDEKNNKGNTALHMAVFRDRIAMVAWLLDHGASLDEKNNDGDTPLLAASAHRSFPMPLLEWWLGDSFKRSMFCARKSRIFVYLTAYQLALN